MVVQAGERTDGRHLSASRGTRRRDTKPPPGPLAQRRAARTSQAGAGQLLEGETGRDTQGQSWREPTPLFNCEFNRGDHSPPPA